MDRTAIEALLAEPRIMLLTANRGGREPLVAPIWYEYRDGRVLIWTGAEAAKTKLLRRNPAVTLCVQTETLPYKVALLRGVAEIRPGADWTLFRRIAARYVGEPGADAYVADAKQRPDASHATLVVTPAAWRAWDYGSGDDNATWIPDRELR